MATPVTSNCIHPRRQINSMEITKELLESELVGLRVQAQEHADGLNAVHGAMQFCEALLVKLSEADAEPVNGETTKLGPQLVAPLPRPETVA